MRVEPIHTLHRAPAIGPSILALDRIRSGFGAATVLNGISLRLTEGGSLSLLGRNGVGKTTLLLTIMGHARISVGTLHWRGRDITDLPPHRRARLGIGWVAQEREIFPSLTVEENLTVAVRPGRWNLPSVYALFPRLSERRRNRGNHLSGGEQQMLAIGRALMTNPTLLLLDEPLEGLAPIIVEELMVAIRRMIRNEGMAVLLVEQHAELALGLTQEAMVIDRGTVAFHGASQALLTDRAILDRFIGLQKL